MPKSPHKIPWVHYYYTVLVNSNQTDSDILREKFDQFIDHFNSDPREYFQCTSLTRYREVNSTNSWVPDNSELPSVSLDTGGFEIGGKYARLHMHWTISYTARKDRHILLDYEKMQENGTVYLGNAFIKVSKRKLDSKMNHQEYARKAQGVTTPAGPTERPSLSLQELQDRIQEIQRDLGE